MHRLPFCKNFNEKLLKLLLKLLFFQLLLPKFEALLKRQGIVHQGRMFSFYPEISRLAFRSGDPLTRYEVTSRYSAIFKTTKGIICDFLLCYFIVFHTHILRMKSINRVSCLILLNPSTRVLEGRTCWKTSSKAPPREQHLH